MILRPNQKTMFMRKTDTDVQEVVRQVRKMLESEYMRYVTQCVYKTDLILTTATATQLSTNLCTDPRGTAQLTAQGINGSLTGKHFDLIFTDDIVNREDRTSRAERERTKLVYQELQNIRNRGGRIFNTGTPWHKEDAFTLMPNIQRYDCYSTGLISDEELADLKSKMTNSLFAANYELKHIAEEDVLFDSPITGADPALAEQGEAHIDAAYGGSDYTAFTICRKQNGKYYVFGKLWQRHVDDVEDEIINLRKSFNAGRIATETNGDKGYLSKSLRAKGERTAPYAEKMNKYIKITTYLKSEWQNVVFVKGTDQEYINQICDYNENAEHDDAPDSLASLIRKLWSKNADEYKPVFL
jgi:predicted phage terminase large subunit-like protein